MTSPTDPDQQPQEPGPDQPEPPAPEPQAPPEPQTPPEPFAPPEPQAPPEPPGPWEPVPPLPPPPPIGFDTTGGPGAVSGPGGAALADWPLRVQSALVDWFGPGVLAWISYAITDSAGLYTFLGLAVLAWALYNAWLAGSTGQSYGKRWAGTRLVRDPDGQLVGGGLGILRHFAHVVDSIICFVGYLFPLWDPKRQTLADKIMSTVVVKT